MKMILRGLLTIALITGWASHATGTGAQGLSFTVAPAFPAGTLPTSVAAGDFNGDGKPDLAVTNQHGVSVLLNDGTGGFEPPVNYVVGTNPQSVAVGDFDGNGKLDLAVVNQGSGTVSILLGNGNGAFGGGTTYAVGGNPRSVVIGDFNGDGKADLAIVDSGFGPGTAGVSVLLGNGNGSFQSAAFFAAGSVSLSVAVGDFNGDGKADLAVANEGSDNVSVLLGNGNGTFQPAVNFSLDQPGLSISPTSVVVGDFNLDGLLDLAVATPNHKDVAVLLGKGNGSFQAPVHYGLDDPSFVNSSNMLATADLNGDGKPDLILDNLSANHVTVLLGKGDGTFPSSKSYAAGPEPIGIAVADFNGDGKPDLAAADNAVDGTVALLLGNGEGTLLAAPLNRSGYIPTSMAVGDLNGDGKLDIVEASSFSPAPAGTGTGVAMLGNGDGTFQSPKIWSTSAVTSVALGDLDGDGKLDLVETNPTPGNGSVSVLLGKGDGTFQAAVPYSAGTTPESVAVADLNGDGKLDLVVANHGSANVSVLLGNGNGTFQTALNYATPVTGTPDSVIIADLNGDGIPDIAAAISGVNATSVAIFLGNGNGTFQSFLNIPSGFHSSSKLSIVAGDFNKDGKTDLAVTDGAILSVLIATGQAGFELPVTHPLVGAGAAIDGMVVAGDFNVDGSLDLAATTRDGISLLLGNGDGTFQSPNQYAPFLGGAIAVGDFDANSLPDLVAADSGQDSTPTDTVAILLNTSVIPVSVTVTSSPVTGVFAVIDDLTDGIREGNTPLNVTLSAGSLAFLNIFDYFPAPGIGYVFSSWSDGGALMHSVRVPGTPVTYTANFTTEYELLTVASPTTGGTVTTPRPDTVDSVGNPFFASGKIVPITATPNPGYTFTGWTGNVADPSNPSTTVTVNAPQTVTANFALAQVAVPNVVGQTQAAASGAITGAGLVVGNVTSASSNTVAAGNVISESPVAGTHVAAGSAVNLVISTGPPVVPKVVSFNVLFGAQAYNVTTSTRTRLPWQITGIRVVFSEPIASGGSTSLGGAAVTGFGGLGTNTLTWTFTPISIGNVAVLLSGSGPNALKDAAGNALSAGAGFQQALKILSGDFNDDGAVSASDLVSVNGAISAPYNIFADMNGDGVVSIADVQVVRARAGTTLP